MLWPSHYPTQKRLLAYAKQLTHEETQALDLLSTTCIKVLENPPKTSSRSCWGYFTTTMRHAWFDHLRHHGRITFVDLDGLDQDSRPCIPAPEANNSLTVAQATLIRCAVESLDPKHRAVLQMRYLQGMCNADIMLELDISRSALYRRTRKGKVALARTLKAAGLTGVAPLVALAVAFQEAPAPSVQAGQLTGLGSASGGTVLKAAGVSLALLGALALAQGEAEPRGDSQYSTHAAVQPEPETEVADLADPPSRLSAGEDTEQPSPLAPQTEEATRTPPLAEPPPDIAAGQVWISVDLVVDERAAEGWVGYVPDADPDAFAGTVKTQPRCLSQTEPLASPSGTWDFLLPVGVETWVLRFEDPVSGLVVWHHLHVSQTPQLRLEIGTCAITELIIPPAIPIPAGPVLLVCNPSPGTWVVAWAAPSAKKVRSLSAPRAPAGAVRPTTPTGTLLPDAWQPVGADWVLEPGKDHRLELHPAY